MGAVTRRGSSGKPFGSSKSLVTVNPLVVVTNFNDGTFSYFVLFHNVSKFLVHDSFHISLSIFQINISPDPGNAEMKQ